MKRILLIAGIVSLLSAAALAAERSMLARVTVYWASGGSGSDQWSRKHIAASGARLRSGHCAVDPRRIPYGSKVQLGDDTLVAVDTGGAVRNRRAARRAGRSSAQRNAIVIDRFFETKAQALAWAKRNPQFMTVRVDAPNESSTASVRTTKTTTVQTVTKTTKPGILAKAASSAKPMVAARSVKQQTTTTTMTRIVTRSPAAAPVVPPPSPVVAPPPRTFALRNSISTVRTASLAAARPAPRVASYNRVTTVEPAKLVAANTRQPTVITTSDPSTPSHFGRAVAYMP